MLVGGGHSHLAVLRRLAMQPIAGLRTTLIAAEPHAPYSGMLPGLIYGWYGFDDAHFDLRLLANAAGARLVCAAATSLDPNVRRITCADGRTVDYDLLSINCGAAPRLPERIADGARYAAVKPISSFLPYWRAARMRLRERVWLGLANRVAVVGAGAGGCELALAIAATTKALGVRVSLIDAGADIARGLASGARQRITEALRDHAVELRLSARVREVSADGVVIDDGSTLPADEIVLATAASGPAWLASSGLPLTSDGLLRIDAQLRVVGCADVFAAGDVAQIDAAPRPRAGVFAVRAGPVLADNLYRSLLRQSLRVHRPQRTNLAIVALPGRGAVAARGNWSASGRWLWRWKDRIDRRFMQRFGASQELASRSMPTLQLPIDESVPEVYCVGCAAKLSADVLQTALAPVREVEPPRADVLLGLAAADDAALLAPSAATQVLTTDGLPALVDDLALAAEVATIHALGDCHAMGASPRGVLAWAMVEHATPRLEADDLRSTMHGLATALRPLDVPLLGGHSSGADAAALGITVVGALGGEHALRKTTAQRGDVLLLCKPLGTAALFAAPMHGRGRARWLMSALVGMRRSLATAASRAGEFRVHAATDITGFGLLGHLAEMLRPAQLAASLQVTALPSYDGALAVLASGVASSLAPANAQRLADFALCDGLTAEDPRLRLLVDPQTCGGLLVALAAADAPALLAQWRSDGWLAAAIGTVTGPRADGLLGELRCEVSLPT